MSSTVRNERITCSFRRNEAGVTWVTVMDFGPGEPAGATHGSCAMFEVPCGDEPSEMRANVPMFYRAACIGYLRVTVDPIGRVLVETVPDGVGRVEVLLGDELVLASVTVGDDYDDGEPF